MAWLWLLSCFRLLPVDVALRAHVNAGCAGDGGNRGDCANLACEPSTERCDDRRDEDPQLLALEIGTYVHEGVDKLLSLIGTVSVAPARNLSSVRPQCRCWIFAIRLCK